MPTPTIIDFKFLRRCRHTSHHEVKEENGRIDGITLIDIEVRTIIISVFDSEGSLAYHAKTKLCCARAPYNAPPGVWGVRGQPWTRG